MRKVIILYVLLVVVGMLLLGGCNLNNKQNEPSKNNTTPNYVLGSLIVTFNNENKDGMIALSTDVPFKEYFLQDLSNIQKNLSGVENISVTWYKVINGANIRVIFIQDYGTNEKQETSDNLKFRLESRWYSLRTDYDTLERTNTK